MRVLGNGDGIGRCRSPTKGTSDDVLGCRPAGLIEFGGALQKHLLRSRMRMQIAHQACTLLSSGDRINRGQLRQSVQPGLKLLGFGFVLLHQRPQLLLCVLNDLGAQLHGIALAALLVAWQRRQGDEAMRAWLALAIQSDSPAEPPAAGVEPLAARLQALNLATRARAVQEQVGRRWPFVLLHLHRFTGERNQSFWHCTRHGRRFKASAVALLNADNPPCPGCREDAKPHRLASARSARRMGLSSEALQEHLAQVDVLLDAERAAVYRGWAEGRTLAEIGAAAGITAEGVRQRLKRLAADHPELKLARDER